MELYAGKKSPEMLDYLLRRRSVKNLTAPGPGPSQIAEILTAAARVPDHGKLFPWYFIVFEGEARKEAGEILKQAWKLQEPDAAPAKLELEAERFLRAPVVIAVVSKVRESKNPAWEQILSAGAACMNLCLAANACGFAACWLSEWYSFNTYVREAIGIEKDENIAGFIYIGTPAVPFEERDRPDLEQVTTHWRSGAALNKGTIYGHVGKGFPIAGFSVPGNEKT